MLFFSYFHCFIFKVLGLLWQQTGVTSQNEVISIYRHIHSKNSRVRFDPEKGPMGPDPFLGQTDLESG